MEFLRGSNSSVIGAHSPLEDMYGSVGGTTGTITGSTPVCGGQLLEITTNGIDLSRYGGCVLTITGPPPTATTTTPGYGQSTRIVGFNPTTFAPQIMAFPDGSNFANGTATFLVNGVPFSGTGFGFDAAGNPVPGTAGTVTGPLALLPNHASNRNPLGGANSDYTAPDFQHIFLAAQVANGATVRTLPSMQRSALCRYWANYMATQGAPVPDFTSGSGTAAAAQNIPPDLKRAIIMRPMPEDNPNFTGSNPTYQTVDQTVLSNLYKTGFNPCWDGVTPYTTPPNPPQFSWDVDNDGDGVPDSVWIDLGMPVQTTSDGRLYKPLFAILCVDLDGRANLNAHGSPQLADTNNLKQLCLRLLASGGTTQISPPFAGGALPSVRGQGAGPAEIDLSCAARQRVSASSRHRLIGSRRLPGPLWIGWATRRRHEQRHALLEQLVRVWAGQLLGLVRGERRRWLWFAPRSIRRGSGGPRSSRAAALRRVQLPGK